MSDVYCNHGDCVHNSGFGRCEANSIRLAYDAEHGSTECATKMVLIPGISTRPADPPEKVAKMLKATRWGL